MFHYSIKEHVSYAQEKEKIFHYVDFTVLHITRQVFFVHTAQLLTHLMHWDTSKNNLNI